MTQPLLADSIEIVSKEAFSILLFLLPGFISAWVFFGLTAYPKKEPFERLVQAFIFTMFIKAMNICVHWTYSKFWHPSQWFGPWNDQKEVLSSICNAICLGFVVSIVANHDLLHRPLRAIRATRRNSHPPNTYNSFETNERFVILTLKDGRRVKGWAIEFPDQCDKGFFLLSDILWLDESGEGTPQSEVDKTLIDVADVKIVQFQAVQIVSRAVTEESIRQLAFEIWQTNEGRRDLQDWSDAEKRLREEEAKARRAKMLRGKFVNWLSNWPSKLP